MGNPEVCILDTEPTSYHSHGCLPVAIRTFTTRSPTAERVTLLRDIVSYNASYRSPQARGYRPSGLVISFYRRLGQMAKMGRGSNITKAKRQEFCSTRGINDGTKWPRQRSRCTLMMDMKKYHLYICPM